VEFKKQTLKNHIVVRGQQA